VPEADSFKLLDAPVLTRLMAQPLVTRFPMQGNVSGHHKSPHRGSSIEFAEYRNYEPGDDIRRLDWRVYGRTDRFYMKEFEAETNLRCYLVLDTSGSMAFRSDHGVKFDYAKRLAATLAYLVIHQGDAAALVCSGESKSLDIPPRRNPGHLKIILDQLAEAQPRGETRLPKTLHDLAEKIRPRAMVMVISDFFCETEDLVSALQHLRYQKHDVALFQLLDRKEIDFAFDRPVRFVDLEGTASVICEPALVREEYLDALQGFLARLKRVSVEIKADYRQVHTDQDYEKVLAQFLAERAEQVGAA